MLRQPSPGQIFWAFVSCVLPLCHHSFPVCGFLSGATIFQLFQAGLCICLDSVPESAISPSSPSFCCWRRVLETKVWARVCSWLLGCWLPFSYSSLATSPPSHSQGASSAAYWLSGCGLTLECVPAADLCVSSGNGWWRPCGVVLCACLAFSPWASYVLCPQHLKARLWFIAK